MTWGIDGNALYVEGPDSVGLMVQGEGEDADAPRGPWSEDASFGVEVDFTATDLTGGSVGVTAVAMGRSMSATLDIAAGTVTVYGPDSTDTADVDLTADSTHTLSADTRAGEVRGKVWAVSDGEPADWAAIAAMDQTVDEGDRFILWVYAASGQTVRVPAIRTALAALAGQFMQHEWIGYASGETERFRPRHRYVLGTLVLHTNGIDSPPIWGDGISARLDVSPTAHSGIHATYIAEGRGDDS